MTSYKCLFLEARDKELVHHFIKNAPLHDTVLLQNLEPGMDWYAAIDTSNDKLCAVAAVKTGTALLYSDNPEAAQEMGRCLLRDAGRHAVDTGHDHIVMGIESVMVPFWEGFKGIARKHKRTREIDLYQATTPITPDSRTVSAAHATKAHQAMLEEWDALYTLEAWEFDPRRLSKEAHAKQCAASIASGKQWFAMQRGAPVMCAQIEPLVGNTALLERIFAMKPMRRPRLLRGAIGHIAHQANLAGYANLMVFEDRQDGYLADGLQTLGFTKASSWIQKVLR